MQQGVTGSWVEPVSHGPGESGSPRSAGAACLSEGLRPGRRWGPRLAVMLVAVLCGCGGAEGDGAEPTSGTQARATTAGVDGGSEPGAMSEAAASDGPDTGAGEVDSTCHLAEEVSWLELQLGGAVTTAVDGTPPDMDCGFGSFVLPEVDLMMVGTLDTVGQRSGQVRLNAGSTSYSTGVDGCTFDVTEVIEQVVAGLPEGEGDMLFAEGSVTCQEPLIEIGGPGEVTVETLHFGTYLLQ